LVALVIASYFLWAAVVSGGRVAGCGDGEDSGCGHVLSSRWSRWLDLPVSLPATVLYVLALTALCGIGPGCSWRVVRPAWHLLVVLAVMLAGTACWFLGLQSLVLHSFCGYCVTAHVCGLFLSGFVFRYGPVLGRAAGRPSGTLTVKWGLAALGMAGTAALIAGQLLVEPRSPGMQVGRTVELAGGTIRLDVANYPRLGPAGAKYVLVELFDYTCEHCRTTAGYLDEARERYGDQLAVLVLVVPLNYDCNKHVRTINPLQKHACAYARLALAVWRANPDAFAAFHAWLIEAQPSPESARQQAADAVGAEVLARALSDEAVERQIQENVAIYARFGGGLLPKLVYGPSTAKGQPANAQQLFDYLEETVGLRGPPSSR
jgi:protein-disulfide isomerase/uncharacterized membrane protein